MSTTPAPTPQAPSIPVFTPTATQVPITGNVATSITNLTQSFINTAPVIESAITNIKTAASMPAMDSLHQALNIIMAADQSITPYIPNATVQSLGGLANIALAILGGVIPESTPLTQAQINAAAASGVKPNAHPNFFFKLIHPNIARQEEALAAQQVTPTAPVPSVTNASMGVPAPAAH